jgi:hypothetical protein
MALLDEARDLLAHVNPTRDFVEVQRRALEVLVGQLRSRSTPPAPARIPSTTASTPGRSAARRPSTTCRCAAGLTTRWRRSRISGASTWMRAERRARSRACASPPSARAPASQTPDCGESGLVEFPHARPPMSAIGLHARLPISSVSSRAPGLARGSRSPWNTATQRPMVKTVVLSSIPADGRRSACARAIRSVSRCVLRRAQGQVRPKNRRRCAFSRTTSLRHPVRSSRTDGESAPR